MLSIERSESGHSPFSALQWQGSVVLLRLALLLDTKQIGHLFQMLTDAFPVHIDFQEVVISAVRQGVRTESKSE